MKASVSMRDQQYRMILKMTVSAMLMALGFVLPYLTVNNPELGQMLLPMHIPVMLCGMVCGWQYGAVVGFALPILRSVTVGQPAFYPMALGMAFELMTYGAVIGILYFWLYGIFKKKVLIAGYLSLVIAMLAGRIVWGLARAVMAGVSDNAVFSFKLFLTGAFANAWPGILLQLVLIPSLMLLLEKSEVTRKLVKK